ncbi:Hypothetical predicted protein [Olea europaea subsp. europaea]|uniref:Uncharacterized protein n=1 Tax=Olea europaea subsp. europaea TaxID=158383 RepID=A0A8S0QN05_OLEEU|nr:Hypothetical predicted protein [Olea europaea subsp. europaea]
MDLARRLHTMKQDDLGIEKQRRPLELDRRFEEGGHERMGGKESDISHQEFNTVLKRGHFWRNCGCERRMKDEKGEEDEGECFEMKQGEKRIELKFLQVDLRFKKVFRGRNDSTLSRSSSGSWLHIPGSISSEILL